MARRPKHPGHKAKPMSQRLKLWGFSCSSSELTVSYIMRLYSSIRGHLNTSGTHPTVTLGGKKLHLLTKCFARSGWEKRQQMQSDSVSPCRTPRHGVAAGKLPERGFRVAQECWEGENDALLIIVKYTCVPHTHTHTHTHTMSYYIL